MVSKDANLGENFASNEICQSRTSSKGRIITKKKTVIADSLFYKISESLDYQAFLATPSFTASNALASPSIVVILFPFPSLP